ncbi:MAG: hypothetical protein RLZZ28_2698 [Bacteroidota bacterium]|jgi:hypothetical protein
MLTNLSLSIGFLGKMEAGLQEIKAVQTAFNLGFASGLC